MIPKLAFIIFLSFINVGIINSILTFWPVPSLESSWLIWVYPFMLLSFNLGSFIGIGLKRILKINDCLKTSMLAVIVSCVLTALAPDIVSISSSLVIFLGLACGTLTFFLSLIIMQHFHNFPVIYGIILSVSAVSGYIVPALSKLVITFIHWRLVLLILSLLLSIGLVVDQDDLELSNRSSAWRSSSMTHFLCLARVFLYIGSSIPPLIGVMAAIFMFQEEWMAEVYILVLTLLRIPFYMLSGWIISKHLVTPVSLLLIGAVLLNLNLLGYIFNSNLVSLLIQNVIFVIASTLIASTELPLALSATDDNGKGIALMQASEAVGSFIGYAMILLMIKISGFEAAGVVLSAIGMIFTLVVWKLDRSWTMSPLREIEEHQLI